MRLRFLLLVILCLFSSFSFGQASPKIMLGIDVLEQMKFSPLKYKRVGLLTHPAGVNRYGKSTVDILYRAKNVKLTALFGPEHGIYGDEKADVPVLDKIDRRTKLPVYSLYGKYRKPTPQMLSKIDVLVIDLQDVGARSYTYISCMLRAMEACFENGKEVMVLDRPNPLGGLKIDGPMLDMEFKSYVGMFQIPYVHAMTIGELARFAKNTRGAMEITSNYQRHGKLTVIPMRGWKRSMLWSDTGLRWRPTSPAVPTFSAAVGYSMTGLGCQLGGFQHGYGTTKPFRLLTFPNKTPEQIKAYLDKYRIRGVSFFPAKAKSLDGKKTVNGLYVSISNWSVLRPTELSFYLMKLTCVFNGGNIFRYAPKNQALLFNKHTGSKEFWRELSTKGAYTDIDYFIRKWQAQNVAFKKYSSKFYIYK
ncbi:MAG: DUF1343 domain-containing protein [Clostridia bacterium]|nr:DUF1343 domain-containing protein [Clostridia bacterium]